MENLKLRRYTLNYIEFRDKLSFLHIFLFLFRWADAEADATKTIAISPYNPKVRRSVARRELRQRGRAHEGMVLDDRYKLILSDYKLTDILDTYPDVY